MKLARSYLICKEEDYGLSSGASPALGIQIEEEGQAKKIEEKNKRFVISGIFAIEAEKMRSPKLAIQILIGLIHIGLGSIMATVLSGHYTAISLYGGFPFWGGIWFIVSGSLSVSAENQPKSSCLLNGSLGLNIVSAICSVVGIILFIMDMSLAPTYAYSLSYSHYATWGVTPGMAISGMLLIFCLLEFCVACASSRFGCQLVCCQHNYVGVVLPNICVANPGVIPEPVDLPPTYFNEVQGSR
ncbi:membrane-spanning 4-domains subfamily A member 8-like [Mirounga leonina]|uniref:membrane-spanning 4-domains subfamily A member 8-like n=1 Tax=Mirounga leonina TaxID=9715 RepID=UPI00156BE78B|nr:membrane-spanning 4-domains subfamily A member 8-like [Mirounga leonina]